ncbi:MAG TPA: helicase-related protein, partial [Labilithrix sp.]|nr:helicase-related protein [Labilithrix sp.]
RLGEFDVLVGINLLREGLDLPEVSLVAIFDADKEGFLRSPRSLIQTMGRAARNVNGRVIMYADSITPAMKGAMEETGRRRTIQQKYNEEHGIVPATVIRAVMNINPAAGTTDYIEVPKIPRSGKGAKAASREVELAEQIKALRAEMFAAAESLDFERAARMRDELKKMEALAGKDGGGAIAFYDPYADAPKKAKASRGASKSSASKAGASRAKAGGGRGRYKR